MHIATHYMPISTSRSVVGCYGYSMYSSIVKASTPPLSLSLKTSFQIHAEKQTLHPPCWSLYILSVQLRVGCIYVYGRRTLRRLLKVITYFFGFMRGEDTSSMMVWIGYQAMIKCQTMMAMMQVSDMLRAIHQAWNGFVGIGKGGVVPPMPHYALHHS